MIYWLVFFNTIFFGFPNVAEGAKFKFVDK